MIMRPRFVIALLLGLLMPQAAAAGSSATLGFVVDNSGTMMVEIDAVRASVADIVNAVSGGGEAPADYLLQLFADPDPQEEHLLHSVWGSAYAQMWADSRASYDLLPDSLQPRIHATRSAMAVLGLAPTLLALLGAGLAALDVLRGRRRALYVPLFACSAATLASFVYFAFAAPMFSALVKLERLPSRCRKCIAMAHGCAGENRKDSM